MTHADSTDGPEFRDAFGGREPASDTDAFGGPEPASDTDAFGGPEPLAKPEDWLRTDPYPAQFWNGVTARVIRG